MASLVTKKKSNITSEDLMKEILELKNLIIEHINNNSAGKRGPKPKNKIVKYSRGETKYDDIYVIEYDTVKQFILIKNGEDVGPVIELSIKEFDELSKLVEETDIGKEIKIVDYKTTDKMGICVDDCWMLSE